MTRQKISLAVSVAWLLTSAISPLLGQSAGTGALTGTVSDPSGARLPNVMVTATNTATNQARTVPTNTDGTYISFPCFPRDRTK